MKPRCSVSMVALSAGGFTPLPVVSMAQTQVDQTDQDDEEDERLHVGD